jgi:hypothetical protein
MTLQVAHSHCAIPHWQRASFRMIETVMLIVLGFTIASLIALLIAPSLWRHAVKLTTRQGFAAR